MPINIKGKSCLTLNEFSAEAIDHIVETAIELKRLKRARIFPKSLQNRNICAIFLKPSTRTRTSFVVAASDEGAHLEIFPADDIRFGTKESVKDIARVLGRMFDGIAFRGFSHAIAEEIAAHSGVPVWNGLTDDHHPTQALADLMTIREEFGRIEGTKVAYVGDGRNNMVTSLSIAALKMGLDLRIVAPPALQPTSAMDKLFRSTGDKRGQVRVTDDVAEGVAGCDVIYTDIWVSMGETVDIAERARVLAPYRITEDMMRSTNNDRTIFMHCLPALHDDQTEFARAYPTLKEVDDAVFEGNMSRVFPQSENRMHSIKALMVETI